MKTGIVSIVGVCLWSFVCITADRATAQTVTRISVTLPHAVSVGSVTLPAEECMIEIMRSDNTSAVLRLRSDSGQNALVLATPISHVPSESMYTTEVILRRSGDEYELHKIWIGGSRRGFEITGAAR